MNWTILKNITVISIMEWTATVSLLVSVALTAYDVYPANAIMGLIANSLWAVVGINWRRWSIVLTSTTICGIFAIGLISHHLIR